MKKLFDLGLVLTLLLGMLSFAMPAAASTSLPSTVSTSQTYTVLVGSENVSKGVSIGLFFPQTVRIHVGDTITWTINSHEVHTVSFLAGQALQPLIIPSQPGSPSPLQLNPLAAFPIYPAGGLYDGTTYANSGMMSTDAGFAQTFSLTFTSVGDFPYICYVHGEMMTGTIQVVGSDVPVLTPSQVWVKGQTELKAAWLTVPTILAKANAQIVPPVKNADGTFTRTITLGYESGPIMVMRFFPSRVTVNPGDTLIWKLSDMNMAPHTVSFFNGNPDQEAFFFYQGPDGPEILVNPAVLFPSAAVLQGTPLNKTDYFNSGLLVPGGQTTFSLKVGDISGTLEYECILHDTSGMSASVFVTPR